MGDEISFTMVRHMNSIIRMVPTICYLYTLLQIRVNKLCFFHCCSEYRSWHGMFRQMEAIKLPGSVPRQKTDPVDQQSQDLPHTIMFCNMTNVRTQDISGFQGSEDS